ncbi:uncharacterized protein LOC106674194 isoform X2 [Cimex lectularius]|uniref:Uncharacterized protein n=1 Tax=Cimex lectularius TaxID=79782 RepID=A0A8I6SIW2_CIMLE|nr:uncharacterized protein LOC106674194 isoform X2 [Cimex lectularius]
MASVSSNKGVRSRTRRRLDFDMESSKSPQPEPQPASANIPESRRQRIPRLLQESSSTTTMKTQQSNDEVSQRLERRCEKLRKCLNKAKNQKSIVQNSRTSQEIKIPSDRGLDSNAVDKSVPIFDVIFPLKKCVRGVTDKKDSLFNQIDAETDDMLLADIEMYSNIANKVLTNRVLEGERKSLERTRRMSQTMNAREQNLKTGKVVEDVLPETVAAFITSEEKEFKSLPEVTYQKLFPEDKSSPTVKVLHTAKNKKSAIIPVSSLSHKEGMLEYEDASYLEFESPSDFDIPEPHPMNIGNKPSEILGSSQTEGDKFDVCLETIPPVRGNLVQLRGSVPPKWFPGYTYALPKSSDTIRVDQPYHIFEEAWKAFSPTQCSSPEGTIIVGN